MADQLASKAVVPLLMITIWPLQPSIAFFNEEIKRILN